MFLRFLRFLFGVKDNTNTNPSEEKLFQDAYWFISKYPHGFGMGGKSNKVRGVKITISFVTEEGKVQS